MFTEYSKPSVTLPETPELCQEIKEGFEGLFVSNMHLCFHVRHLGHLFAMPFNEWNELLKVKKKFALVKRHNGIAQQIT